MKVIENFENFSESTNMPHATNSSEVMIIASWGVAGNQLWTD
jgi:hypothetical protein